MRFIIMALAATAILPLTGCGETSTKAEASGPQAAFMTALHDKCGRAYRGKMVSGDIIRTWPTRRSCWPSTRANRANR